MESTTKKLRFDMHTHSKNSHDSECEVLKMAESEKSKNITGFAVTDHCDIEFYDTMDLDKISEGTISDAAEASEKSGLTVLKGIEIGEAIWNLREAERILNKYDFDVVLGSVHAVRFEGYEMPYSQIDFSAMGKSIAEKYTDKYFDDMAEMLDSCDFDVLSHLTCPLRYINGKFGVGVDINLYTDKIKNILKRIIKDGKALEVNTSCVYEGSGYCEYLPNKSILEMYKSMGGYLITTGSDAHIAENAANGFDKLYDMLKEIGFDYAYYYKDRKAIKYEI